MDPLHIILAINAAMLPVWIYIGILSYRSGNQGIKQLKQLQEERKKGSYAKA